MAEPKGRTFISKGYSMPPELHDHVARQASAEHLSKSQVVAKAVRQYLSIKEAERASLRAS